MGRRGSDRNIDATTARPLPPSYNRRIGTRSLISPIPVSWLPASPRKHFRRAEKPREAVVDELSVTGARVRAHADPAVRVGTQAVIDIRGASGWSRCAVSSPPPTRPTRSMACSSSGSMLICSSSSTRAVAEDGHDDVDWRWRARPDRVSRHHRITRSVLRAQSVIKPSRRSTRIRRSRCDGGVSFVGAVRVGIDREEHLDAGGNRRRLVPREHPEAATQLMRGMHCVALLPGRRRRARRHECFDDGDLRSRWSS